MSLSTPCPHRAGEALRLEALGLMTAGIVHDLGNMVQVLSSAIHILDRHPHVRSTEALRPVMAGAIGSLDRVSGLVQQILGFAREDDAPTAPLDVALALAGMERLLRWMCPDNVALTLDLAPSLPSLECNRRKLENAILNLVLNAFDAMPQGGQLTVAAQPAPVGAPELWVSVRDNGSGISPDLLGRIFEPFFSTKGTSQGNGLGLPMVRRFARETGGDAVIESRIDKGTCVTLHLPVAAPHQKAQAKESKEHQREERWLDATLADSFPASDPLPQRDPNELRAQAKLCS